MLQHMPQLGSLGSLLTPYMLMGGLNMPAMRVLMGWDKNPGKNPFFNFGGGGDSSGVGGGAATGPGGTPGVPAAPGVPTAPGERPTIAQVMQPQPTPFSDLAEAYTNAWKKAPVDTALTHTMLGVPAAQFSRWGTEQTARLANWLRGAGANAPAWLRGTGTLAKLLGPAGSVVANPLLTAGWSPTRDNSTQNAASFLPSVVEQGARLAKGLTAVGGTADAEAAALVPWVAGAIAKAAPWTQRLGAGLMDAAPWLGRAAPVVKPLAAWGNRLAAPLYLGLDTLAEGYQGYNRGRAMGYNPLAAVGAGFNQNNLDFTGANGAWGDSRKTLGGKAMAYAGQAVSNATHPVQTLYSAARTPDRLWQALLGQRDAKRREREIRGRLHGIYNQEVNDPAVRYQHVYVKDPRTGQEVIRIKDKLNPNGPLLTRMPDPGTSAVVQ
jgi:hypothetical protein